MQAARTRDRCKSYAIPWANELLVEELNSGQISIKGPPSLHITSHPDPSTFFFDAEQGETDAVPAGIDMTKEAEML